MYNTYKNVWRFAHTPIHASKPSSASGNPGDATGADSAVAADAAVAAVATDSIGSIVSGCKRGPVLRC